MEIKLSSKEELKTTIDTALSTNGYFIKTDPGLPLRSQLKLSFTVQGHSKALTINSEIVFKGGGGVGVNFTESQVSISDKLNAFLSDSQMNTQEPEKQTASPIPAEDSPPEIEPIDSAQSDSSKETESTLNEPDQSIQKIPDDNVSVTPPALQAPLPPVPQIHAVPQPPPSVPIEPRLITGKMKNVLKLDSSTAGKSDLFTDFGELSFTKILLNINEGNTTGIIRLQTSEVEKIVYFKKGRPVFVESNPPLVDESIGNILLAKGKIKKEDLDQAIEYVEENGVRIGEAMIALKSVSPTLLKDALTYQLRVKLYELFTWTEADFEMQILPSLTQKFGTKPVNVISIVYRGLREKLKDLYPIDLEKYITPIYDKFLLKKEDLPFDIEHLGFTTNEKRFWELLLAGKRRVRQIFEGSTMNKPDTFRFLYALLELDLLHINDQPTLDIPNIEKEIRDEIKYMERRSYFDILGVHWSSSSEKVEEGYKRRLDLLAQKKKTPRLSSAGLDDLNKMASIYKKAYEALVDINQRREYRKEILGETEAKIAAELAARQAQLMEFKNDMNEARELMAIAMDLNPAKGEYKLLFKKYGGKIK